MGVDINPGTLICNYLNQLIFHQRNTKEMQNMNPSVIIFSWWWYSTAATFPANTAMCSFP